VITIPAKATVSSSIVVESGGGECWNCSRGSRSGNGGGVSVRSSSSPVLVVLLVSSSGGGEEVKR